MIKLNIKNKTYNGYSFVNNLNLDINSGDFVMIKGPSGSGKSTLLNILNLLDNDYTGYYMIDNVDMTEQSEHFKADFRRDHFGIIFQDYNVIPQMTVYENIIFALKLVTYKGDKKARAKEVIELVELTGHEHKKYNELSGGQQQRIGIARAVASNPDIIFADEPTGNLDPETSLAVLDIFSRLNAQGKTIIMITHYDDILTYANRVITIEDGAIVTDNSNEEKEEVPVHFSKRPKMSFFELINLGFLNLRRHKVKYLVTNITLIGSLLVMMFLLVAAKQVDDFKMNNIESNYYEIDLNYDQTADDFDFNTVHDAYLKVGSQFKESEVITEISSNAQIIAVNDLVLADLSDDQLKNMQSYVTFVDYTTDDDEYYLEKGYDPENENEIVITENFIKTFMDPDYNYKTSDPSQYVGQSLNLSLLSTTKNILDYKDEDVVDLEFTITGIDNSKDAELTLDTILYTNYYTLTHMPSDVVLTPNLSVFVNPTQYKMADIMANMEILGIVNEENYDGVPGQLETYSISAPENTSGNFVMLMFFFFIGIIIMITIIMSMTLSTLISQREKEFGIYYALGLDQYSMFLTVATEFLINTTLVSVFISFIAFIVIKVLFITEILLKPTEILIWSDYIILLLSSLVIAIISLVILFRNMMRYNPIKLIKKI